MFWWKFLDILLYAIHVLVILFNLFGWLNPKWRRLHFWSIVLTTFSWLGLGFWRGWGYCFLTDWAWRVKIKLGETDLPNSFITYLLNHTLDFNIRSHLVDQGTAVAFVFCVILAIYYRFKRKG